MRKTAMWLIGGMLALAFVVFVCLYFIPKTTPIDITLDAVKTDTEGNEIGTLQITLRGSREEYLFQKDRLALTIDDFDHLYDIRPWANRNSDGNFPSFSLVQKSEQDYYYLSFLASSTITGEDSVGLQVVLRRYLKKWEFFTSACIYTDDEYQDSTALDDAYRATVE